MQPLVFILAGLFVSSETRARQPNEIAANGKAPEREAVIVPERSRLVTAGTLATGRMILSANTPTPSFKRQSAIGRSAELSRSFISGLQIAFKRNVYRSIFGCPADRPISGTSLRLGFPVKRSCLLPFVSRSFEAFVGDHDLLVFKERSRVTKTRISMTSPTVSLILTRSPTLNGRQ